MKYNYIDKGLNFGAILLILLVIFIAWRLLRKKEDRIEYLEEEVDEFEHAKVLAKKALIKKVEKQGKPLVTDSTTLEAPPVVKKKPTKGGSSGVKRTVKKDSTAS